MGDSAFSLPTLLVIAPAAGGLVAMSMLTRRAAAITSLLTFLVQLALLVVGVVQLDRFADRAGSNVVPSCGDSAAREGANVVLAQCSDWFPQWGIQYHVSLGYGALGLVALTTLVTAGASAFSWWADRERPAAMQGLMWITAACLTGLFVARDLVLFYVFFELMLVPMLLLVGVWGGAQRIRATMTMFIYTLLGSLPMLVGVIAVGIAANDAISAGGADLAGSSTFSLPVLSALAADGALHLSNWVLVAFLLAFAIKAPLLPFHGWLPLAYREAPAEVTAMLSGLVSKAAFFGFLVVVLPLFPEQLAGGWGTALTWLALASLVYGCFGAFRQPDPRGVIAYSSLAQMGLIVLGLTSFTGGGAEQGIAGAYLQSINHGLVSAAAFLFVGVIELRTGEREFARLGFLGTGRARLVSIGLVIALITLAVPGATTFAGELLILAGVFRGDVSGPLVATIGSFAVVLAAMYALRLVAGLVFSDRHTTADDAADAHARFGGDLGVRELLIIGPAVVALLVLSAWPNLLHRPMNQPPVAITTPADPLLAAAAAGHDEHESDESKSEDTKSDTDAPAADAAEEQQ
ncbi:MAG: NADH-quinone oxidoreductase subunit [Thermoleophilia bacterium]|nr:NADH-quinone oxidoreductase subunit [Thermoleophilia bacterium]